MILLIVVVVWVAVSIPVSLLLGAILRRRDVHEQTRPDSPAKAGLGVLQATGSGPVDLSASPTALDSPQPTPSRA